MAFDLGSVVAHVKADLSDFNDGMNKAKAQVGGLKDSFTNATEGIVNFGKQAAVFTGIATTALILFGKKSIEAFNESEAVMAQTNAVLKSTGKIAGVTAEQIIGLAKAFQKTTIYSDETVQSGENLLLTFTGIGKNIFPQATETMLNMSTALGQDLKSSAIQLGKALQDPILGVTALRRVGVNFNEQQQDMIKGLVESGHMLEAQTYILKELKTEFGGSAEAMGKTFGGQMAILKNRLNDVQESIGKILVQVFMLVATGKNGGLFDAINVLIPDNDAANRITNMITGMATALRDFGTWVTANQTTVLKFLEGLAIGLTALLVAGTVTIAITTLTNPLFMVAAAVTALYVAWQTNFLGIRDITDAVISSITTSITWLQTSIENFVVMITPTLNTFTNIWNTYIAPEVTRAITTITANLTALLAFFTNYLLPGIQVMVNNQLVYWNLLRSDVELILNIIKGLIQIAFSFIVGFVTLSMDIARGNWAAAWNDIYRTVSGMWAGIQTLLNGGLNFIGSWGGKVVEALTKPFNDAWNRINDIVNKIKGALDFTQRHSPSVLDIVNMSVGKVNDALGNLIVQPNINTQGIGQGIVSQATTSSALAVNISLDGAIISDDVGAQRMAEKVGDSIIRRLQNNVRM